MQIVDMHCDSITMLMEKVEQGSSETLLNNRQHIDLTKMKKGDYLLQNFAVFTNLKRPNPREFALKAVDFYKKEIVKYPELIRPVYSYKDIEENISRGIMSSMLTLEEGSVVGDDLNNLNKFYADGVRMITLTWNYPNGIGHSNTNYFLNPGPQERLHTFNTTDGLTDFGFEYVKRMNELGIIVDVSHLSDAGFYDVVKTCKGPFVASHSNARALCHVGRNLSDDMIEKLADKGGVTGLNYYTAFTSETADKTLIEDMIAHIKHIINVGGIDVMGLGSDFDGIDPTLEIEDCSQMGKLIDALKVHGFSSSDVDKITHENVLRVYKEVLK